MVADLGFETGMFAGSIASMAVLGAPDLIVLTLSEFADQAHRICRAADLPLLVDADHGSGNALNVMRTVEELESAGVAALTIEDTVLPRPFDAGGGPALVPLAEGVGKMRAAVAARRDPSLVIAARTSALALAGFDEAIARARAYTAAGVDALFLIGVNDRAQLAALDSALELPIILGGAGPDVMDRALLAEHGVRVCVPGHQPYLAGVRAVYETLRALRDGTAPAALDGVAAPELIRQLTRDADYASWTDEFLS